MKTFTPFFSQNPLDRMEHKRDDKKTYELLDSKKSLFLIFDGSNIIVNEEKKQYFFKKEILDLFEVSKKQIVLLGTNEEKTYFAYSFKNKLPKGFTKISLRDFVVFDFVDEDTLGILAQASSVLNWHDSHTFCSACGEKTKMVRFGWRRDCLACKKEHFPRVDAVVIMLVTHGDYCLIGRGVNFKENRYSCLAGYMESGETIEDASRRELFEESGVIGGDVKYLFCQPWPFPSTLMIGTHVEAKTKELKLDYNEIADALWVHKDDIKAVLAEKEGYSFTLPQNLAIARNLLEYWIEN